MYHACWLFRFSRYNCFQLSILCAVQYQFVAAYASLFQRQRHCHIFHIYR